jgi:DNA-binding CsgD family transcriptional regulator
MEPARFQATPLRTAVRDDISGVHIAPMRPSGLLLAPTLDPLSAAAVAAERSARPGADLAAIWQAIMERRLIVCGDGATSGGRYLVAGAAGDTYRSATASKWYKLALAKLRLTRGPLPLALVIAAQAWASGKNPPVNARDGGFEHDGARYFVLSVPRPVVTLHTPLTPAECEVARFLVEGESRWDVAARRGTSAQTVACQLRGIFAKCQLGGRYGLIRRAVDLGWFR